MTLDGDVAAKLHAAVRKTGRTFEDVVNESLRKGLALENRTKALVPFRIEAKHVLKLRSEIKFDEIALEIVSEWLDRENVVVLEPGPRHWPIFLETLKDSGRSGSGLMHVHLAAPALEHGAPWHIHCYSNDRVNRVALLLGAAAKTAGPLLHTLFGRPGSTLCPLAQSLPFRLVCSKIS